MEASFEIKMGEEKDLKLYSKEVHQTKLEEQEMEEDLSTTYALVCILIFILNAEIFKSIFNIFILFDLY